MTKLSQVMSLQVAVKEAAGNVNETTMRVLTEECEQAFHNWLSSMRLANTEACSKRRNG